MAASTPPEPGSSAQAGGRHTAPELEPKLEPGPEQGHEGDHGHSVAAWTSVGVVMAGFLIGAVALVTAQEWLFFVGVVVIAVGAVLGKVLAAMGFGAAGRDTTTGAEGVR
jgi:hypothetical protein